MMKINDDGEEEDDDDDDNDAKYPSGKRAGERCSESEIPLAAPLGRRRCCRRPLIIRTACGMVRATR